MIEKPSQPIGQEATKRENEIKTLPSVKKWSEHLGKGYASWGAKKSEISFSHKSAELKAADLNCYFFNRETFFRGFEKSLQKLSRKMFKTSF